MYIYIYVCIYIYNVYTTTYITIILCRILKNVESFCDVWKLHPPGSSVTEKRSFRLGHGFNSHATNYQRVTRVHGGYTMT